MKYVTNSEHALKKLLKPVFISKAYRKTILENERLKKLEAKRLLKLDEKKKESCLIIAKIIQKESQRLINIF
ncbi:20411_t:CDS:2 [Cetraspora pellucida]|uniref:20411_t:CDS:1 n=1 Tax=Cetraspora pellucida TaxID=1433469 RepID=A0A9N9ERP9_9GLOM|nr:20411_t:CDS:2 [Cetraspora pellucida]